MNPTFRKQIGAALAGLALIAWATSAGAKDVVKVAFIGPLTGSLSADGLGGRNSAELAVKHHNADPKSKYEFQLVVLDDECKPSVGVQVATKAATDPSVMAVSASWCSAATIAEAPVFTRFKLPNVVWAAVLPSITNEQKVINGQHYIHRVSATLINQNRVAAKFMTGSQQYKRWAAIYDTTDYGKEMIRYFDQFLKEEKGTMLASFGVPPDQQDLSAVLTKIKELNPEVVYFGGLTPLGVRVLKQMDKLGIKAQLQGTSGMVGPSFVAGAGAELAEGVIAAYDMKPVEELPGGKFFVEEYAKQKYNEPFAAYGPYAYSAMTLIMDTIEKTGPNREKINIALGDVKNYPAIVGNITFDDLGQNISPQTTIYVVQDGEFIDWNKSQYASGKRKLRH
jgi:ABC-type branched-chain amino acid transport systems, periplasmic component